MVATTRSRKTITGRPLITTPVMGLPDMNPIIQNGLMQPIIGAPLPTPLFELPLTQSLIPTAWGSGASNSYSYSRATVAYVQDHEGVQLQVLANEARIWGARRVRNTVTNSQVLNVTWSTGAYTVTPNNVIAPDGSLTADTFTDTSGLTNAFISTSHYQNLNANINETWAYSTHIKPTVDGNFTCYFGLTTSLGGRLDNFNTTNGVVTYTGTNPLTRVVPAANGFYRILATVTLTGGAAFPGIVIGGLPANWSGAVWGGQVEHVTGQSARTPAEYVSTGVLSSPWQGANVDGVQYMDTVRLHTQNFIDNSTLMVGWSTANVAANVDGAIQGPVVDGVRLNAAFTAQTAGVGQHYTSKESINKRVAAPLAMTAKLRAKAGLCNEVFLVIRGSSGASTGQVSWILSTGAVNSPPAGVFTNLSQSAVSLGDGWWEFTFNFTTDDGPQVAFRLLHGDGAGGNNFNGVAGVGFYFAGCHLFENTQSMLPTYIATTGTIDPGTDTGVKAAIPATTNYGFFRDLITPVTQLIANTASLRNWTATWVAGATMGRAFGQVGIDGIPSTCTRLTGGAVAATNYIEQTLAAVASDRTFSCYIRRVTGTGPVRLYQGGIAGTSTDWASSLVAGRWVRCYINANVDVTALGFGVQVDTNGDIVDVDFAQFEANPGGANTPIGTSFIPTGGGVRNADSLAYSTAGNIININGGAYVEATSPLGPMNNISSLIQSTNNEVVCANAFGGQCIVRDSGGVTVSTGGAGVTANTTRKYATKWQFGGNKSAVASGSNVLGTNAFSGSQGVGASLQIGISAAGSLSWVGCLRNIRIFAQPLTDAQLRTLVA
jgi:hypothetical protein